jgi:hypothetical protein
LIDTIDEPFVLEFASFELMYEDRDVTLKLILGADPPFQAIHQRVVKVLRSLELLEELFGYLFLNLSAIHVRPPIRTRRMRLSFPAAPTPHHPEPLELARERKGERLDSAGEPIRHGAYPSAEVNLVHYPLSLSLGTDRPRKRHIKVLTSRQ